MNRAIPAFLAAVFAVSLAAAGTWRTYVNPRFGVSAEIPADWTMGPPPENDDGRLFTSPDGRAEITVSGMFSTLPREEEFSLHTTPQEGETITYNVVRGDLVVVSGTRGNRIFYRKSLLNCAIWNDVAIEYPAAEKARYDPLVVRVAASLKPGRGYSRAPCP